MNLTADQSYGHAVLKPSKHAGKPERLKNLCLNLLYIYCNSSAICSNYLVLIIPTSLNLSLLNPC